MSEVIGFLFSFLMAVLILVVSLMAFSRINDSAADLAARAELQDVVNRVSLGVQESLIVATVRNDTAATATSSLLLYQKDLHVPQQIQGFSYEVTLDKNFVNGTISPRNILASIPTFNAAVNLPPEGDPCETGFVVCELSGTVEGNKGRIVISYLFDEADPTIEITIQ